MPTTGPPTILFEVFWTQQQRKRLVEVALEGTDLPPDDYPFYVMIGADGPLTPTALAEAVEARLGSRKTTALRKSLIELRQAIDEELLVSPSAPAARASSRASERRRAG